jgi:hypothetical protein
MVYGIYVTRADHEKRVNRLTMIWIVPENGKKATPYFVCSLPPSLFTCLPIHLNRRKLVMGLGVGEVVLGQHI